MRVINSSLVLVCLALLAGCATPDSRIADNKAAFDKFPAEIQQKIRTGQVDVGFTKEMVVMSLGEPANKFTRKTEAGDTEVWSYRESKPAFSIGLGVGSGGGGSSVGCGVGVSTGGYDPEEKIRLEFHDGLVSVVDLIKRK